MVYILLFDEVNAIFDRFSYFNREGRGLTIVHTYWRQIGVSTDKGVNTDSSLVDSSVSSKSYGDLL